MHSKHPHLAHPRYRPDIDGLRAIAVLSVIGFHAFPEKITSGFVGVDIFFVISGFLISSIIFSSLERDRFSFVEFYSRRVKRIFPALLLVMAASLVFDRESRGIINKLLLQFPQVRIYDPYRYLCDEKICKVAEDRKILYIDGGHMSAQGGEFLAEKSHDTLKELFFK